MDFKIKECEKLKEKNYLLVKENTGLKENMFKRIQENMFWKQKCKKLELLIQEQSKVNPSNNFS
jgi:hypothetical protein